MTGTWHNQRHTSLWIVSTLLAAIMIVGFPRVALAYYPPGCETHQREEPIALDWGDSCWVGYNYDQDGNYTAGFSDS